MKVRWLLPGSEPVKPSLVPSSTDARDPHQNSGHRSLTSPICLPLVHPVYLHSLCLPYWQYRPYCRLSGFELGRLVRRRIRWMLFLGFEGRCGHQDLINLKNVGAAEKFDGEA